MPAVVILDRRSRPPGTSVAVLALLYAPVRFLLDFLRQTDLSGADVRYHGLTVAQYGSIVLGGIGISLIIRIRRRGSPVLTGRAEGATDHSTRLRQRVTRVHYRAQGKRPSDRRSPYTRSKSIGARPGRTVRLLVREGRVPRRRRDLRARVHEHIEPPSRPASPPRPCADTSVEAMSRASVTHIISIQSR